MMQPTLFPMEEYPDVLTRAEMGKVSFPNPDVYKRNKLLQMRTKKHSEAFDEVISG